MSTALELKSADRRFPSVVAFLAAKAVEYISGVSGLVILSELRESEYRLPTMENTIGSLVLGSAFVAALYFVALGYVVISTFAYFATRIWLRGQVKPITFALALSATFGVHAFAIAIWAPLRIPSFYLFIAAMMLVSFAIHYLLGVRSLRGGGTRR